MVIKVNKFREITKTWGESHIERTRAVYNEPSSSVQLLTKLQLFLYIHFHFYHEKSNSQVPIYEYGLVHCLTGFWMLELHCGLPSDYQINLYLVLIWNKTGGFDKRKIFTLIFFFSCKIKSDLFGILNCTIKLIPRRLCNCKQCAKFESCAIWRAAWPQFTQQMISLL